MIVIGVDESGTGAWAGPFTVCAIALHAADQPKLLQLGVKDSKVLSDDRRRRLVDTIVDYAVIGYCAFVEVQDIKAQGQKEAWRRGAYASIMHIVGALPGSAVEVIVDGNPDLVLKDRLLRAGVKNLLFKVKADATVPAVSAASIVAKTLRNDRMVAMHEVYPEYLWGLNMGYGTPEHQQAIDKHGKTIWHRPVKNLSGVSVRTHRS